MEFGDRHSFAVQLELDRDYNGTWLFGRFCYWINATEVGNFDLGTSLRDVFFSMKWIVVDCGHRHGMALCDLPADEVFQLLNGLLYDPNEIISNGYLPETPARFDITPKVDVFDDWKIFLLECAECDCLIYKRLASTSSIETFKAPKGAFCTAIKQSYDYLEHLYESATSSHRAIAD
jgi:hypothetical protein